MVIREMSREECLRVLAGTRLARVGCSHADQPYVVPVSLAYSESEGGEPCLYGVTTPGQKVEWMRANPLVCVEVDQVTSNDQWVSVIVFGRYEELPDTSGNDDERLRAQERLLRVQDQPPRVRDRPLRIQVRSLRAGETMPKTHENHDERLRAYDLLKTEVMWWEPGWAAWLARADRDPDETYRLVYYKIRIDRVTGHESTRDTSHSISHPVPATPTGSWGWLRERLTRVFGGRSKMLARLLEPHTPPAEQRKCGVRQADGLEAGRQD
jgi:uncharacterized protein